MFELSAEQVPHMFQKLIRLRAIAEIVNRNAAAEIYVLECVARFPMNRDQMFPHAAKSFRKRLNIWCLRADVNVNAANVDQFRVLQTSPESIEHLGRRDAKLRSQQGCLQSQMGASAD